MKDMEQKSHGERRKTKPSVTTLPILKDNDNVSVPMHAEKTEDRNSGTVECRGKEEKKRLTRVSTAAPRK
jgi:hypothetical protein